MTRVSSRLHCVLLLLAAVGYESLISYINLQTPAIEKTQPIPVSASAQPLNRNPRHHGVRPNRLAHPTFFLLSPVF